MSYFLSNTKLAIDHEVTISGEEARHLLLARRVKPGESVELQDESEQRFTCEVLHLDRTSVTVHVLAPVPIPSESPLTLTIGQALTDEKALDLIIQKTTELGVTRLLLFNADRTPARLGSRVSERLSRWQKIAAEAAKQCGRVRGVDIIWQENLTTALTWIPGTQVMLYLSHHGTKSLSKALCLTPAVEQVAMFIGPEGGWSKAEEALFKQEKVDPVVMGPRILRSETAALATAALVQGLVGDMV